MRFLFEANFRIHVKCLSAPISKWILWPKRNLTSLGGRRTRPPEQKIEKIGKFVI